MTPHQNMDRLEDWVAETPESINARLEGAKASQAQTRWTIGAMAVISVMMLIAAYNAYLSYDYQWITDSNKRQAKAEAERAARKREAEQKGPGHKLAAENFESAREKLASVPVANALTEQALKDWASSRIVLISLLGIRVSVDDAAVLGSSVLLVLSLWLLLVTRRENHTIGFLLRDTDTPRLGGDQLTTESRPKMYPSGERWLIFHTIASNSLFVTFDSSLASVHSLDGPNPLKATATGGSKGWLNEVGFGLVRRFFFLFPVVASIAVFGLDRWSYFMPDPFDPYFNRPEIRGFFWRSMVVFFVSWIPLTICCWRSSQYSRATEKVLREYGAKLRSDLAQGNDVLDKPDYEQKESRTRQGTAESKRIYVIALLFACIFIASTTILFLGVGRVFHSTSDTSIWVIATAIVSAIGTISTTILGWRKDRREVREQELKITQLQQDLAAARDSPALPAPQENRE